MTRVYLHAGRLLNCMHGSRCLTRMAHAAWKRYSTRPAFFLQAFVARWIRSVVRHIRAFAYSASEPGWGRRVQTYMQRSSV